MPRHNLTLFVATVLAVSAFTLASGTEPAEESHGTEHTAHAHNEISIFLGVTAGGEAEGGGKEDGTATIGVDYRRNLSRLVGVGAQAEFAGGERRDGVILVPVTFLLGSRAQLVVGAGVESSKGTEIFAWMAKS